MIANLHSNMIEPLNRFGEYLDTLRSSFLASSLTKNDCMREIFRLKNTQNKAPFAACSIVARARKACQTGASRVRSRLFGFLQQHARAKIVKRLEALSHSRTKLQFHLIRLRELCRFVVGNGRGLFLLQPRFEPLL